MGDSTEFCKNCRRNVSSANFASHSAFCERRIKLCEICDEPVQISEFKEHEDEYHIMVACEKCDIPLEKWMLPKHQESCSKRLVPCEICEADFPFDAYPEHKDFCGSRTEKCIYCRKYIMMKEKDTHYEVHKNEFRIKKMKESVKDEIQQNSVNEVIKTHLMSQSEQKIQFFEKETDETQQDEHIRMNASPRRKLVTGASSSVRNESENFSKHYVVCHICKGRIRWVDMNTHVPACASSAGKCSRCGDSIPADEIKDHILKNCPRLKGVSAVEESGMEMNASGIDRSYETAALNNPMPESIAGKSCPFCLQICDEERILEHVRNCDQNTYECPLCSKILPEKDKRNHESFYCEVLLDIQSGGLYPNVPQSKSEIPRYGKERRSMESVTHNSEACPKCKNSFPKWRLQEHLKICQSNMKSCKFCGKNIRFENERSHLNNCLHVCSGDVSSRFSYRPSVQHKGAVPKYADQVNLEHEPESVNCIKCTVCEAYVPVNNIENHHRSHQTKKCCHNKKGKKCSCEKQSSEGKSQGPVKWLMNQMKSLTKSDPKEGGYCPYEGNSQNSSYQYQSPHEFTPYSNPPDESLYFSSIGNQEDLIPCEFCEQTFPMSQIVLHSTGCKPDLVSFATKDNHTPEDVNINKSNSHQQKRSTPASRPGERDRFLTETRTSTSSRQEYWKRTADLLTKPGEFLDDLNQNTHNKNIVKYESVKPEVDQALNQYSEVADIKSNIVSLWNVTSTSSNNTTNAPSLGKIPDFINETVEKHEEAKNSIPKSSSYIKSSENEDDISVYVSYIRNKEKSNLYEEEEPKKRRSSEMEPVCLNKLSQVYSSREKVASDDSDSETENVESALEACEAPESKMCEESSKIQAFVGENDKMDVDTTLPEDNKSSEQKIAFKIEPATQYLSSEKKVCKKTWKIEALGNKAVNEDLTKTDINKPCLANFKFGLNRNVVCNENKMECEESSAKDENENREAQSFKTEPAQKPLQNGAPRDKIAANFYDNIQESHDDFVKIAYKYKLPDDQKRNSIETADDEKEKLEKWIKWRSRKSSDSE